MNKISSAIVILAIFFLIVIVINPEIDPNSRLHSFEYMSEWTEINLFTPSTTNKQEKHINRASERLDEIESRNSLDKAEKMLNNYTQHIKKAEDIIEVILFLEGTRIPLALGFEQETRSFEQRLAVLVSENQNVHLTDALNATRDENKSVFMFIVEKYQFDEDDIETYGQIVRSHIAYIENTLLILVGQKLDTDEEIQKAREFLDAGLNTEAYRRVDKVKDKYYAELIAN